MINFNLQMAHNLLAFRIKRSNGFYVVPVLNTVQVVCLLYTGCALRNVEVILPLIPRDRSVVRTSHSGRLASRMPGVNRPFWTACMSFQWIGRPLYICAGSYHAGTGRGHCSSDRAGVCVINNNSRSSSSNSSSKTTTTTTTSTLVVD